MSKAPAIAVLLAGQREVQRGAELGSALRGLATERGLQATLEQEQTAARGRKARQSIAMARMSER